jgi:hypothetical protein
MSVFSYTRRCLSYTALFAAVALPFSARGELLFRSLELVGGKETWSEARRYSELADIAFPSRPTSPKVVQQEVRVTVSGTILPGDGASAEIMARLVQSGRHKISGNQVTLVSDGGDMEAAMQIGRQLRKLGIFTKIAANDQCMSACVFAFMGGERRTVAGKLGIHRPYFPTTTESSDRIPRYRALQRAVRDYVDEMDFPQSFYEAVMLVPPESMQFLQAADLKRFYLEGISPSSEEAADAAAARRLNLTMVDYLKLKAAQPGCALAGAIGERGCTKNAQAIPVLRHAGETATGANIQP